MGIGFIVYTEPLKRFTGSFAFAERYFGRGGTYTLLKICGLLIIIGAFLWGTDTFERLIPDFLKQAPH